MRFVLADHEDRDVGFLGGFGGGFHAVLLRGRVDQFDVVGKPSVPVVLGVGDLAAFGVDDVSLRADAVLNSLQDADAVRGFAAVSAEVHAVGIGADHGNGLELGEIERQQVLVVLEEDDCLLRGLQRERAVLGAVGGLLGVVRIDIGIVEQAETELRRQHAGDGAVDHCLRDGSLLYLPEQRAVDGAVGEVVVNSGCERHAGGVGVVRGDVVGFSEHLQAVAVGGDVAAESPLLAQDFVEQPVVDVRRDAVDFVVGGHHAAGVGLFDRGLKGHEEVFANDALGIISWSGVGAAFGLSVNREVLGCGDDVMAVDRERIALQASDGGDAHARGEERIFAVGFFGASPARVAGDVEHGAEDLADSCRPGFIAGGGEDLVDKVGVPRAGEAERLRETGAAVLHESVERFAHEERGNAEARFLAHVALHTVAQDGRFAGRKGKIGVPPALQNSARRLGRVCASRIHHLHLSAGATANLLDLFFQRHAREQVGDPVIDGQSGVLVFRSVSGRRSVGGFFRWGRGLSGFLLCA